MPHGIGTQYGPDVSGTPGPLPSGDLASLSDAQLAELQRRIAEETACRLAKTCPRN